MWACDFLLNLMPSIFADAIALLKIVLKVGLLTGLIFISQS